MFAELTVSTLWCRQIPIPNDLWRQQVKFISAPAAAAANLPFSQVVKVRRVLYLSGALGNVSGKLELVPGGIEAETRRMMQNIGETLTLAGSGYDKIFKCVVYLADMKEWAAFNSVYATFFQPGKFPARTAIGVNELIMGARVEMECWAEAPAAPKGARAKGGKAGATAGGKKAAKKAAAAKRRKKNKKKRAANA
jgi:reactive intermediate/imine deaminase